MNKLLFTLHETAEMLSCSYLTLFRMSKTGKLKTVRINTRILRVPYTELERIAGVSCHDIQAQGINKGGTPWKRNS